jgi:hypothetical protein
MANDTSQIERLRKHHGVLEEQLQELQQLPHPTGTEQARARELKKRKLLAKDRIAGLLSR